jgi:hypothetical protein
VNPVVKEQILAVRDSGETNMLDVKAVFEIAVREGYGELADFIFMDTAAYSRFILTGDADERKDGQNEN